MANINLTAGQNITLEQDGNNLIINGEAGGGASSDIVIISDEQPTSEDNKIWIDTGEVQNLGSEVHIGDTINSKVGLNILMGKNLIDLSSMLISGGYGDTGYVASTNYITIQYIQVRPNTTYTLSTNLNLSKYTALRIVDFDSNKTFIRRSSGTTLASSNTFTTSNDAYYIALCFYTGQTASISDITQAQLEKGSTATTYQAYITPTINVDGEDIYVKGQNEVYSTNEIRIGTWIDGKPLYRKVFTGTLANSTQTSVVTLSNEKLKIAYGNYNYGGNILFFGKSDNQASLQTRIQVTILNSLVLYHTTDIGGSAYELVIEYTKTTD